jgi:hypothetical protein
VVVAVVLAGCSGAPAARPDRAATRTPDPAGDGVLRILFVGNSHTANHDVPGTVARLLRQARPGSRVEVEREPTNLHLQERSTHEPTLRLIAARPWDYVVLQAQDYSMSGRYDYPTSGAIELAERVRAAGAEPVLFAEWARRGIDETARILQTYGTVAKLGDACLPPVPEAFDLVRGVELRAPDGNHSSEAGAALAAAVIAGALQGEPVAVDPRLDDAAARALSAVAEDRRCPVQQEW